MTNDDRDNLLLLAAGALSDDEARDLRVRLATGSPEEIGALAEAEAVLAQLPLALPLQSPSADAKAKLMDRIAAAGGNEPVTMRLTSSPSTVDTRSRLPMWMSLAASVLIFAVSLALMFASRRDVRQANDLLKTTNEELATARAELVGKELSLNSARIKLAAMNEAMGAEQLQLVGLAMPKRDATRKARGRILWDKEKNQWLIAVYDLMPPADKGRQYELWFITPDQKKIPSKAFSTSVAGDAMIVVDVPKDIGNIAVAAITDEPMGGSPVPTGDIHLVGKIE